MRLTDARNLKHWKNSGKERLKLQPKGTLPRPDIIVEVCIKQKKAKADVFAKAN